MNRCLDPADLEGMLTSAATDPRRRHVEDCVRCRALMLTYQEFLEDTSLPVGALPREAAARLRAAFGAQVHADAAAATVLPRDASPRRLFPWLRAHRSAAVGLAATVVLCAVGLYTGIELRGRQKPADMLRRQSGPDTSLTAPALLPPVTLADGAIRLSWRRVPAAEAYEVRLMGPDLADLTRLSAMTDTFLILLPPQLPRRSDLDIVGWQVAALLNGREVARSSIGTLHLP